MSNKPDMSQELARLSREVEQAEQALRDRFTATSVPSPETIGRIKAGLHAELSSQSRGGAHRWWRPLVATAATVLLAVGFYAVTRSVSSPADDRMLAASGSSLETFTASLPTVLSDEDPEIAELRSELRQLEAQAADNTADMPDPDDPAVQRGLPHEDGSIAAARPAADDTHRWIS